MARTKKYPPATRRVVYHGRTMDAMTREFIKALEHRLGYLLTITQGCYSTAVAASGGTHSGGGVIDLAAAYADAKVRAIRELGGFGWRRLELWHGSVRIWPEHVHFGIRNHPALSPEARAQQADYDAHPGRNGLAGHAVDPDTYHPNPPVTFRYPPIESRGVEVDAALAALRRAKGGRARMGHILDAIRTLLLIRPNRKD